MRFYLPLRLSSLRFNPANRAEDRVLKCIRLEALQNPNEQHRSDR